MIKLFDTTDKLFNSNGDKVIIPTRAVVHKEDNGSFSFNFECDLKYIEDIEPNKIVVTNTPQGDQAFRIRNIDKTKNKIKVNAKHVFYDSENYVIEDSYVVEKTCNQALDHLNNATDDLSPFTMASNINTINSYRCVRKSLYEAINVVLERWGGHLVRDNFEIKIMDTIGKDNGVVVRYGKNLKEIEAQYNWDNVVTKILPVGTDGLKLPEVYLASSTHYDIPYTKVISFDQGEIVQEDYEDEQAYQNALINDLRYKATQYLEMNSIPKVNYTLRANLERISDVGDTIEVIDERLGINLMTNLISFDYDCILEKYIEVQFGNFSPKLSDLMTTIASNTNNQILENNTNIRVTLGEDLDRATSKIYGVLGNSNVIYDGDKILIVDRLPKELAQNVIMINSGGIGFSNTGINGTFRSAWTIDNILNMENINVLNLTADLIKGGVLNVGGVNNTNGQVELYDNSNKLVGLFDKTGITIYAINGDYVKLNANVGVAGYNKNDVKVYWADGEVFHMKNAEIENELKVANKVKIVPVNTASNTGIGFVALV